MGEFILPSLTEGKYGLEYHVTPETVYLHWEGVGYFRINGGNEITVDPVADVAEHVLMRFIIGSALGVILYQRGELALHASAVAGQEGAIAFIGEAGWGKSTLAATLHTRGYQLVTDDILAVRASAEGHQVFPGFPELKLWPDSIDTLGENSASFPKVFPGHEKRVRHIDSGMQCHPLPMQRIYVLAGGAQHKILPLSHVEAALELMRNTYGITVFHTINPQRHFQLCTSIAQSIPVRLLQRRASLDELSATIELIEEDLRSDNQKL